MQALFLNSRDGWYGAKCIHASPTRPDTLTAGDASIGAKDLLGILAEAERAPSIH